RLNRVVLPAPLGPMMALNEPSAKASETSRVAATPPKDFTTPSSFSMTSAPSWPLLADAVGRVAHPLGSRLAAAFEALGDDVERTFAQAQHQDQDHDAQHELGVAGPGDGDVGQHAQDDGAD